MHGGGTCAVVERDWKVTEVQGSVVGRLHDLAVGDADAQTMGSRHFVDTGCGGGDEIASATGIEHSLVG